MADGAKSEPPKRLVFECRCLVGTVIECFKCSDCFTPKLSERNHLKPRGS